METEKKVILTGTLLHTPFPQLTKNRTINCLLKVKTHRLYFVHKNASKGNHLTIPGLLIPGTAGIKAEIIYKV